MSEQNKIVKMGIDLFKGSTGNFSADETEHALREQLNTLLGAEKNPRRALRNNGKKIFTVMEDILDVLITEGLEDQFNEFVDYRNVNYGDKPIFMVDDYHLFNVATIAAGNNNIRKQRLERSGLSVPTAYKGVAIYEELERFLAGKVDWNKLIAKVQRSFNAQIATDINNALVAGYSALNAPYKVTGAFDLTNFNTLVQHVEAASDRKAMVLGNRTSLQKVSPAYVAYGGQMIEQRNQDAFFKVIDGTTFAELRQSHVPGTDNFAISNMLLVLPTGEEKIIKLVLEGESEIVEANAGQNQNSDDSVEYIFKKKYGVAAIASSRFGVMTLA